jgi:hypothetical protein
VKKVAFKTLSGIKIVCAEQDFVVGDYFAVYNHEQSLPRIYRWEEVYAVAESVRDFAVTTSEGIYRINKEYMPDVPAQLRLRALFEGVIGDYRNIKYTHNKRILPTKNLYHDCDVPTDAYVAQGVYNDREISYSNVALQNMLIGNIYMLIWFIVSSGTFLALHFFMGRTNVNWFYFLPIAIMSGMAITMFAYLAKAILSKFIYADLLRCDPALTQLITFVVSDDGFAAVESDLFNDNSLIPWHEVAFFLETNYAFILYRSKQVVFWLPKRFFPPQVQREISDFITRKITDKDAKARKAAAPARKPVTAVTAKASTPAAATANGTRAANGTRTAR